MSNNENKSKKLPGCDVNMIEIKRACKYNDNFIVNLFE